MLNLNKQSASGIPALELLCNITTSRRQNGQSVAPSPHVPGYGGVIFLSASAGVFAAVFKGGVAIASAHL
eukprot:650068-Pyramimonas_sp.AAC.1